MHKKLVVGLLLLANVIFAFANDAEKKFTFKPYGFVRNDFYSDTYKGLDVAQENFYLVPYYTGVDANGNDINKNQSSNLTALATRLGVRVSGPEVLRAQTSAVIEGDFAGITKQHANLLRIRLAYVDMKWEKVRLRMGQDWHPYWTDGLFPTVASFNTGAPFMAFNRSPQVRVDRYFGGFSLGAAVLYENQFTSKVLGNASYASENQAQRNGGMPEISVFASQSVCNWNFAIGGEVKRIQPRFTTTGTSESVYRSDEYLTSYSSSLLLRYKSEKLMFTARTFYGQNMTHLTMLGGYAVATKQAETGAETYTNFNTVTALFNIVYGVKWQVGAFGGYGKNLGTSDAVYNNGGSMITAGLLPNVMNHWRLSAHMAYNIQNMRFVLEYELTEANYGVGDLDFANGLYGKTHGALNNRVVLSMAYTF
ncbi:MAG: hypothetical protein ACK5JS_07640 [Mangrovibacterium sp.]